jgi:hypothetical protein
MGDIDERERLPGVQEPALHLGDVAGAGAEVGGECDDPRHLRKHTVVAGPAGMLSSRVRSSRRRISVAAADAANGSPLPGSPKRKLREYASLYWQPLHIPSARASGFKERDRQTRNQLPGT